MNAEAFSQVEQLYHSLLTLEPEQQRARLAVVADAEVRREVERLLSANARVGDFLQSPLSGIPDTLDTAPLPHTSTRTLGPYHLQSLLGKGGMGEVYLADDTRLARKVALKLLPTNFTSEADRVRRFAREAKAASALNHPNILTIYDIGQEQGTHYIATEYIVGTTLHQRLAESHLPLRAVLDITIQITSALVAAHEAGIIHRDIKPENVMVRTDGLVKVLDFGLAKLAPEGQGSARPPRGEDDPTLLAPSQVTDPGTVMGTASYMSPEQARGQEVDARTDIFSLGVMLYEMIAGCAPFAGVNALDVISDILKTEPAPLSTHTPDVPAELQRIVTKALRKERDERYQTAKDLLLDVKSLQQELDFAARLKGVQNSEAAATTMPPAEAVTQEVTTAPTTSSAKIILSEIKRHKIGAAIGLGILFVGLMALGYGFYRFAAPKQSNIRFQNAKFTRLTSLGNVRSAAISPDGKFIAYVQREEGRFSLWTRAVTAGSAVQIIPPLEVREIIHPVFSPKGDYVYYLVTESSGESSLYQIPVLGGTPKKILQNIESPITFSPDGKQFAFVRFDLAAAQPRLLVAQADGSNEHILKEGGFPAPAWSPDSKTIAIGARQGTLQSTIFGVDMASEKRLPLSNRKWAMVWRLAWFKDGSGLVFGARENAEDEGQLWWLSLPDGTVRRLTNDLNTYSERNLSLTADSSALVTIQSQTTSTLWRSSINSSQPAQQITSRGQTQDGLRGLAVSPKEQIIYTSTVGSNNDLWIMNGDGSQARPLTENPNLEGSPVISPDGRYIVFYSVSEGFNRLWRVDIDGNNLKQLIRGIGADPAFSPDGRWVYYSGSSPSSKYYGLWKVPIEGGDPVQITETGRYPTISPDGQWIAYVYYTKESVRQDRIAIIPTTGGAPTKILEYKSTIPPIRWSPDGQSLFYVDASQGGANLWRLPLDGSPPKPVTDFKSERIQSFDLTRDGKQFIIARGTTTSDVVMISETK